MGCSKSKARGKFIALNIYGRKKERSQLMASASIFKSIRGKKRKETQAHEQEGITMSTRTNKTKKRNKIAKLERQKAQSFKRSAKLRNF